MSRHIARELSMPAIAQRWGLSEREVEVFRAVVQGESSAAIAARLGVSVGTVRKHRENLMRKLKLHNVAELTAFGFRIGLVR